MRKALLELSFLSWLFIAPAWADPLKEIAEVAAPRAKAYSAGDLDGWTVADGYYEIVLTDRSGKTTEHYGRYTAVWAKLDGRWQIIQQQNSVVQNGR